jgi:hypothetical protein
VGFIVREGPTATSGGRPLGMILERPGWERMICGP